MVWGANAKDNAEPVRVEQAFPAIITKVQFSKVGKLMQSRAPKRSHPRRVGSTYLLSGLVKCKACGRALSGQDAKSGQFSYYVCQSIMKRGKDACVTPRLNARRFEQMIVDKIRSNILTEGSITDDDYPQVTVMFEADAYTVAEGDTVTVTITLSADPERTVTIPLTATDQDGAASTDYTVPTSVTFDADEMSKTITFTAADDSIDDDDESVLLAFGTLPTRGDRGDADSREPPVSITDDDERRRSRSPKFAADHRTRAVPARTTIGDGDDQPEPGPPMCTIDHQRSMATNHGSVIRGAGYTVPDELHLRRGLRTRRRR